MPKSTRIVAVAGLALAGLAALVARQATGQDREVQRTASSAPAPAAKFTAPIIGCIDISAVLEGYKKVEFLQQQTQTEALQLKAELDRLMSQGQQTMQEMEKLTPSSEEFRAAETKVIELRAKIEAGKEQAQRDIAMKQAQAYETVYKEIQQVVKGLAERNGLTYVVQISNDPVTSENPDSVLAALSRTIVYSDRSAPDLTQSVINYLNSNYEKTNPAAAATPGPAPAPAPANPNAPAPSGATPSPSSPSMPPR